MTKYLFALLALITLYGCQQDEDVKSLRANTHKEKVWVFTQFNVPEDADSVESYYYYGRVSKPLYEKIAANELTAGFILLEDVKYWGNDDLIKSYNRNETKGTILFRIEDLRKLDLISKEPQVGLGYEQFERKKSQPTTEAETSPTVDG